MAEPIWLKGQLTGTCVGKPTRKRGGSGLARWYSLELVEAVISDWTPVPGPPTTAPSGPAPFNQATLSEVRLRSRTPGGPDEALALRELSVWDWKMGEQREGGGESRCTLTGVVYAQEVAGTRRPYLADEDRLGSWGCLGVLAGLLAALWLWWSCGPVTSGLWATVVLASWWSHRRRTRRRSPPSTLAAVAQSFLALVIVLGGVGLVVGLADPSRAGTCSDTAGLAVVLAAAAVVAVSLLTISWPLPWVWALWTLVVVLWCGRAGTDCAFQWIRLGQETLKGTAPPRDSTLGDGFRGLLKLFPGSTGGDDAGIAGPAASPSGGLRDGGSHGRGGPGGGGDGDGDGDGSGAGKGRGKGKGNGSGDGDGDGNGAGKGEGKGDGSGAGTGDGDGDGSGSAADKGAGKGRGKAGGDPAGQAAAGEGDVPPEDTGLEASSERRMSVESALSDPKPFLDGSSRVTLNGDLLFSFDEDKLKPQAGTRLQQVARLLQVDPKVRVLLEGHADTIGGDQYNQELSERRAFAVKGWLVDHGGIDPMRIDSVGYGSSKPIVPASRGPSAQQPNRRVEVQVMGP